MNAQDNKILIFAENVVFPNGELRKGPFYVVVKRGIISKIAKAESMVSSVAQCQRCDAITCHLLAPGFVDIHNYGTGNGDDFLEYWKRPDYTCAKAVASGTTSLLATVVFPEQKADNEILSVAKILQKRVQQKGIGAVIEGIHVEGPLISDLGDLQKNSSEMDSSEFENLLDEISGLKVMTVSPHVAAKKNFQAIQMLHERGIVPALGHDRQADEQEITEALSKSKSQPCHVTHLFNVSKFHHRNPGLVNFGLLDAYPLIPKYENAMPPTVELIGDMIHVHPLAVKLTLACRSWDQIVFVTGSMTGKQSQKAICYGGRKIQLDNENHFVNGCDENTSEGSCCTMMDIFKNLIDVFDVPVGKAVMMLTENPARIAKLENVGTIEVGKDANILMFDAGYNLMRTYVCGRMAFRASSCRKKSVISTEIHHNESMMW